MKPLAEPNPGLSEMPRQEDSSFTNELASCWQALPNKGMFFGLLAAWIALFHVIGNSVLSNTENPSLLYWLYGSYNNDHTEESHGMLIPFAVLGLLWWKRKELLEIPTRIWWPAMLLIGGALLLHVCGFLTQQPRLSAVAFFGGIYCLVGLVWGRQWMRTSFFPFCLFVFSVPIGIYVENITFPLRMVVTQIVGVISSGFLGLDVIREGTQLYDAQRSFQYEVAAACSGIRSLFAIAAIATILAFVSFRKQWKRLVMIASAIPIAVLSNVFRMMVIVTAAEAFGQSAGNYVHESAIFSLLPYIPGIGALLLMEKLLRPDSAASKQ